jgi:hypothetical protein
MKYSEMSLNDLRELARTKGIGSITRYRKAELIELLEKVEPQELRRKQRKSLYRAGQPKAMMIKHPKGAENSPTEVTLKSLTADL